MRTLKEQNRPETAGAPDGPIDYAPRTLSQREQIAFGVKLAVIVGLVVLVLWLMNRMV